MIYYIMRCRFQISNKKKLRTFSEYYLKKSGRERKEEKEFSLLFFCFFSFFFPFCEFGN